MTSFTTDVSGLIRTIILALLFCTLQAQATSIDIHNLGSDYQGLAKVLRYAPASSCPNVTPQSVLNCNALKISEVDSPNLGFLSEDHWFVATLNNPSAEPRKIYLDLDYALLDKVRVTIFDDSGKTLSQYKTGDMTPFGTRPVDYPTFVFPVEFEPQSVRHFSVLIETGSSMQAPLKVWQPEAFVTAKSTELMLFGLFIGAMIIMAIYNFLLFASTRDKSYLFFSATLLFYALTQSDLTGISFAYLWPNSVDWNNKSLIILASAAMISLGLFSAEFLRLNDNSFYTKSLVNTCIVLCSLWVLLTPFIGYQLLIVGTAVVVSLFPFILYVKSIQLWIKGYIPARYFVMAFSCFVIAMLVYVLNKFGVVERTLQTEYAMHVGAAAVVILLSLALADQVNQEKRARERAQASAIESLRKFEEIYNNSSEGMFRLSVRGQFVSANQAFLSMLKADSLAELEAKFADFDQLLDDDQGALVDLIQQGQLKKDWLVNCVNDGQIWAAVNLRMVEDPIDRERIIEGSMIDISDRKASETKLSYLANYDQLTGLINRNAFQERLRRLIDSAHRHEHEHSLLYIDLDRFKLVNDTCGHHAGDALLKQLALIFTHKVRQRDATARIGGDEFVILLENCDISEAVKVGEDIKRELNKFRFNWHGKQFDVGASIGIVSINQYSESVVSLMNLADSVCLMAKEQGRDRIVVHDDKAEDINEKIQAKNLLATIHDAIDKNKFTLFKQRIAAVGNDDFNAYEILIRMQLSDDVVGPGVFIPTAERYNVMPGIDRWVVREFVEHLRDNPQELESIDMATINLSGQTLSNPDFLPYVLALLEDNPAISKKLCFELTESAALNNLSESSELVTKIKSLGARFAVDDFGSGYASYSYLTQLPIDFVKIDGSFCVDIDSSPVNQMVVRSITEISHTMGTKVIAEFVETREAMMTLQEIGVDMIQGYYIDRPSALVKDESEAQAQDFDVLSKHPAYFT